MKCIICLTITDKLPSQIICENNHTLHTKCLDKLLGKGFRECPSCNSNLTPIHRYNLRSDTKKYQEILNTNYYQEDELKLIEVIKNNLLSLVINNDTKTYFSTFITLFKIFKDNIDTIKSFGKIYFTLISKFTIETCQFKNIFNTDDMEYKHCDYILNNLIKIK